MSDVWLLTLQTVLFIFAIWAAGDFSKAFLLPPIISEILIGIIMGPHVLNIVPFTDVSETSLFSVLGTLGVTLLIAHLGLHVNVAKIKTIGLKASIIGVIGTILPTSLGMLLFWAFGYKLYPEAFIGGIAITPASVSVAMRVLFSMRKLNTIYGQTILTAAYIDDFLSIMLFIFITNITLKTPSFVNTGLPIIGAFLFAGIAIVFALTFMPIYINKVLDCLAQKCENFNNRDKIHMMAFFIFLIGYSIIGHYIGSHLLGEL